MKVLHCLNKKLHTFILSPSAILTHFDRSKRVSKCKHDAEYNNARMLHEREETQFDLAKVQHNNNSLLTIGTFGDAIFNNEEEEGAHEYFYMELANPVTTTAAAAAAATTTTTTTIGDMASDAHHSLAPTSTNTAMLAPIMNGNNMDTPSYEEPTIKRDANNNKNIPSDNCLHGKLSLLHCLGRSHPKTMKLAASKKNKITREPQLKQPPLPISTLPPRHKSKLVKLLEAFRKRNKSQVCPNTTSTHLIYHHPKLEINYDHPNEEGHSSSSIEITTTTTTSAATTTIITYTTNIVTYDDDTDTDNDHNDDCNGDDGDYNEKNNINWVVMNRRRYRIHSDDEFVVLEL